MVKIKKKKFWYLSFSSLVISLWSTSLFLTTLAQPYLFANSEPHKSLSSYFERKNVSPHYFQTVVITTEQGHPGEKGICLRFQYTSTIPKGET